MTELTTTNGEVVDFDPGAVTAVADLDADTGQAETCVYGLGVGVLRTNEPTPAFLNRTHLTSKVAKLTRPDASPIWIVGAAVTALRRPLPDDARPEVKAVVVVTGLTQGVTETVAAARTAINAAGGHL